MVFGKSYFEKVFQQTSPWGYAASEYERIKYLRQLEVMRRYCPEPRNILEIGCAQGAHTIMMAQAFPSAQILSLDISHNAIECARHNCHSYPNIILRQGDIARMLKTDHLTGSFDIVVQSECLYYMLPSLMINMSLYSYVKGISAALRENAIFVTSNGVSGVTKLVMGLYYLLFGRFSSPVHSSEYREWNEYRSRFITYDLRVFQRRKASPRVTGDDIIE